LGYSVSNTKLQTQYFIEAGNPVIDIDSFLTTLTTAMREIGIKQGLILTLDETETIKLADQVVTVLPIYQWMLSSQHL